MIKIFSGVLNLIKKCINFVAVNLTEDMKLHKHLVPVLYTLLWGISIHACTWNWSSSFQNLPINPQLFEGACSIFIAFMIECIINFLDFTYVHKTELFNIKFVYWLIKFAFIMVTTIILTILLFKYPQYANGIGILQILSLCWLKYINVSFTSNVEEYMGPIQLRTYVSSL